MREYITIYEHSVNGSDIWHVFGILSFVIFGFGIVYLIRKSYKNFSIFRQVILFFGWSVGVISLVMLIVFLTKIPGILKSERELKSMIKNETYLTVEGLTEDFEAPQEGSNHFESFIVNGVKFRYSDYLIIKGYHTTSKTGGPIDRNGLMVRIGYTHVNGENIILKLEISDN
jgi:hypothetical protein